MIISANQRPVECDDPQLEQIVSCLSDGKPVRQKLSSGARVHMDRPLPFICVHEKTDDNRPAAYDVTTSNASYLIAPDMAAEAALLNAIGQAMSDRFGAFLVITVSELDQDRLLTKDSPYLPDYDIELETGDDAASHAAITATAKAIAAVAAKYRSPVIQKDIDNQRRTEVLARLDPAISFLSIRFAPIYRQPDSDAIYPDLRERLVANIFDALLQGVAAFATRAGLPLRSTHRAWGRSSFIEPVKKLDMQINKVAGAFDFLMAVTPINTDAAWQEFEQGGKERAPSFLYRPLTIDTDAAKRTLFSTSFENLEDPVLYEIYREKQRELDLQLTAIDLRDTARFKEASRLLYGPVEPDLLHMAHDILALPRTSAAALQGQGGLEGHVDCFALQDAARRMVADYRAAYEDFDADVVIRDDVLAGMIVSGPRLLVSRSTRVTRSRVVPLLSHEIGVHLVTYFAGDAQGLRIFRSGLAGYEGLQEGLAVFAEYLVGGLTPGRLRLLAARVVGCAAMLEGADFTETYRLLGRDHGFSDSAAFNLTVRLYRSGGLAKDAIYLRGLRDVLDHVAAGKPLEPFWLGKFANAHLPVIEELTARGLLKATPITPSFLAAKGADKRLAAARAGLTPPDIIA